MNDVVLGIDLGTTYSVMAYVDEDGNVSVIPNAEQRILTPSVVLIEDGRVVAGEAAANQMIVKEDRVVRWIKRSMWDESYRFQGLSPVEISAEILRKMKRDAEAALQTVIEKAVITCPAYFSSPEARNTRKAGELAGFEVLEVVREPTAAAVYYGVENLKEGERVLVYDLGGGTFDATLLEFCDGTFDPLATLGERQLGGHDWTSDLLDYVARKFEARFGRDPRDDPVVHQALYERCEMAKRDLAKLSEVIIACTFERQTEQVAVDYDTFAQLTEQRIRDTLECCAKVLTKAQPPLAWSDVGNVLLVGGSTRLRRVPEALEEMCGKAPIQIGEEVDTAVALGAAVIAKGHVRSRQAGIAPGKTDRRGLISVRVGRACPRNLGTRVIVKDDDRLEIRNSVIIPYGTKLPAQQTRDDYKTVGPHQQFFDVPVVEFDDIGVDVIVGTYRFTCVPRTPAGSKIAVTFRYDKSGIDFVEARDARTGDLLRKEEVAYVEPDLTKLEPARKPRNVVFCLDVSGSMSGGKLAKAKTALIDTASQLLAGGGGMTSLAVVAFSSTVARLCELTTDLNRLRPAVQSASTSGSTRMDRGISEAAAVLSACDQTELREIALVTDGMPDDSDKALQAAEQATQDGVRISAIGIGSQDVDEGFLRQIASGVLMVDTADQLAEALPNLLMQADGDQGTTITWGG